MSGLVYFVQSYEQIHTKFCKHFSAASGQLKLQTLSSIIIQTAFFNQTYWPIFHTSCVLVCLNNRSSLLLNIFNYFLLLYHSWTFIKLNSSTKFSKMGSLHHSFCSTAPNNCMQDCSAHWEKSSIVTTEISLIPRN